MKREYLFILITIVVVVAGLIYKGMFVSDKLNETQNIIIENNDRHAKFKRDTVVQSKVKKNIVEVHKTNKRDDRTYGEVIADLLKITEDILKEAQIEYDVNDINQDVDEIQNWPKMKTSFYINVNFKSSYEDLVKFISIVEKHQLLINITSMNYSRIRPILSKEDRKKKIDEFSIKTPLVVKARLEYLKFL